MATMTEVTSNPDAAERYLRQRLPEISDLRVHEVTKRSRGVSRETWEIRVSRTEGEVSREGGFIVRRDPPGGSVMVSSLRFEYEVYRRLWDSAVPVARARWFEDDPAWLDGAGPFYVRDHVEGTWKVPGFTDPDPRYDDLRVETSKEHIRKLALVHTCDWEGLGFGEIMDIPSGADTCAQTAVDRMLTDLRGLQTDPFPEVTDVVAELRATAPVAPRVTLLKGTNGLGEEIWRDGKIVAMSDWEMASLGDPASDWAHLQGFAPSVEREGEQIWGLQHALDYYESCSGIRVEPEAMAYYRRILALEMVVYAHNAGIPLVEGRDLLVRRSWVSTEMLHRALATVRGVDGLL